MKKLQKMLAVIMAITVAAAVMPQRAEAAGLCKEVYKIVKGQWWYESSSGGYDARITKKKIKYYDRKNYKLVKTASIQKCVKKRMDTISG